MPSLPGFLCQILLHGNSKTATLLVMSIYGMLHGGTQIEDNRTLVLHAQQRIKQFPNVALVSLVKGNPETYVRHNVFVHGP